MNANLRAFHLVFLEALDLSRKNGCHEVVVYRNPNDGEYGTFYAQHGPPGSINICHVRAATQSVHATLSEALDSVRKVFNAEEALGPEAHESDVAKLAAAKRTWRTDIFFVCESCHRLSRASQEAIDNSREQGETDEDVVAGWQFCLSCCDGEKAEGEHVLCEGEEDEEGNATCAGPDVVPAFFRHKGGNQPGEPHWYDANWCRDCRNNAKANGYDVLLDDERVLNRVEVPNA